MAGLKRPRGWSLADTYGFISRFLTPNGRPYIPYSPYSCPSQRVSHRPLIRKQYFHNYFTTHLPSTSLHPDSRGPPGPHHKLPRSASSPHAPSDRSPASLIGASRELTVVRIPLRSAKHHFGVSVSRGTRPYNEDTYQAGTLDIPAFAKRAPVSLSRSRRVGGDGEGGTAADGASGDPQVFYFGVFDGHGGSECSDFLREELHGYVESAAKEFELGSSLEGRRKSTEGGGKGSLEEGTSSGDRGQAGLSDKGRGTESQGSQYEDTPGKLEAQVDISGKHRTDGGKESLQNVEMKSGEEVKDSIQVPEIENGRVKTPQASPAVQGSQPINTSANSKAVDMEQALVKEWRDTVGGYFQRFKPDFFSSDMNISIETVLMYAFLKADLDFITAQARKPDDTRDMPLNDDEILGRPARLTPSKRRIGGPTRFAGGSTASIAMISTPTASPFWHPASPSTLMVAHVGDTRILLCSTATGLAKPVTTNHHPSSPVEGNRLRRYAATFVTDSFGEERMSGLANTRAFGDMRSKRIGVCAEPELVRLEMPPAEYSFLVLISDGVSGTLSDQEIVDVVKEAKTPEQGARDVVGFATEVSREGDNATCLVVRLGGWERRLEGGMGGLGTKEVRDFRKKESFDPRNRRT